MAITKKIRFEVFKRDKFTCQYCGQSAPDVTLQVDHIEPKAKGGSDDMMNLVTSCVACNQGKKDRPLSDQSVIQKRKRQLDELQERREQLEMLMQWQRGLMDLDDETINALHELWKQCVPGYSLTDGGLLDLKKWIKRYDVMAVADAIRVSAEQYLRYEPVAEGESKPTAESARKAFSYVPRIIANKQRMADKPHLKELYYIRGILKNRLSYCNPQRAIQMLEAAYDAGATIESLTGFAKTVRNWTAFVAGTEEFLSNMQGGEDE